MIVNQILLFQRKTVYKVETTPKLMHKDNNMRVTRISVEFMPHLPYIHFQLLYYEMRSIYSGKSATHARN
jgi:hypothetical protein